MQQLLTLINVTSCGGNIMKEKSYRGRENFTR